MWHRGVPSPGNRGVETAHLPGDRIGHRVRDVHPRIAEGDACEVAAHIICSRASRSEASLTARSRYRPRSRIASRLPEIAPRVGSLAQRAEGGRAGAARRVNGRAVNDSSAWRARRARSHATT